MKNSIFYSATFRCLIRDRETILFQGDAYALTTINEQGKLDILPQHTHFISIIQDNITIITADGKKLEFPVLKGILKVFDNEVKIYLGIFSSLSKEEKSNQQSAVSTQ